MHLFQVPLTLDQQRKIASVLNTFVYNSFSPTSLSADKPLINVATRCLHLLYERDCRHQFCPDSLWLAPSRNDNIPIAAAARAHDAASMTEDELWCAATVVITVPHVYPFEKRYTTLLHSNVYLVFPLWYQLHSTSSFSPFLLNPLSNQDTTE
jgi:ubiquitin-protein ligase E3 B